jgi:hypothetical protein
MADAIFDHLKRRLKEGASLRREHGVFKRAIKEAYPALREVQISDESAESD